LVHELTGWKFDKRRLEEAMPSLLSNPELASVKHRLAQISPAEQLFQVYEKMIEHTLIDPCFVTHIPSVIIPLARENKEDPFFADVYELAINGVEISPGYTELNDPDVQAKHFGHQVGDEAEKQKVDEDFLNALRYGMPPAGGLGLGIDRLVMMLTGSESIRDVILFPLMKPQEH
jgi:lysyl-tRNA synthetase class 2